MAFCTSCGTPAIAGNRFCVACGSPLRAVGAAAQVQAATPNRATTRRSNSDTLPLFTTLAGGLALVGGFLAAAALFLPSSSPNRLWFFWTWRAEFLRWDLVGAVLPLFIAGALTLALGRTSSRWALGCVAAATFVIARVGSLWTQSSEYSGFLHPPSIKSLVLLFAVAASAGSAALAVTVVVRGDPPLVRVNTSIVTNALVTGAMLSLANVLALQWASPPDNFLSVNTVGFYAGVPVALVIAMLVVALLYAAVLVGGAICGPQAAIAVAATISGAWVAFIADGLRGLGRAYGQRITPGVGFVLTLIAGLLLARFVKRTIGTIRTIGDRGSPGDAGRFPYVAAWRTVVALVAAYLLLLMPLHVLTTGYRADGRRCDTPIDAALSREYRTREVGGSIDPITNGWTEGRRVRVEVRGPCKSAASGRMLLAAVGFVLIGGGLAAAWVSAPGLVRRVGLSQPESVAASV